ncbi:MAG: BlaI/MecI/CopY family transcriptional regulator [Salinisphaeraceae bacterium]|uniref:BlaI/MecI/CopY family transcriptional regulator n=2 Tax=Spectribacter TaxID=3160928 RepID=A0ABU3C2F2_9GAMM|nr:MULTISPECIES: BlaI/MecI/CopY family transcriptional regulator [unclassified Salinisphaera]MDT0618373.1 BlaI/MecI/CopY family transcriptional regulator [Salinisphaera sp. P385]MDT0635743.1 BlaI/MecI/CopY family transcriptional regulator [Salinisphaera sp. W335]
MRSKEIHLPLGELELEVMECLWDAGPAEVKAVYEVVGKDSRRSLNTVQSTLERLYRKQLLSREKRSRAYIYSPIVGREALLVQTMGQIADTLGARDSGALMASFVELAERDDPANLERLQQLIDAQRRQRDSEAGQDE